MIVLNNTEASGNGTSIISSGAYLHTTGVAGVSILGTLGDNYFDYNGGRGLEIVSNGAISINKFYASVNDQEGIVLNTTLLPGMEMLILAMDIFNTTDPLALRFIQKAASR